MKHFILVILVLVSSVSLFSQQRCGTKSNSSKYSLEAKEKVEKFYKKAQNINGNSQIMMSHANNFNTTTGTVMIPVVVHVVHKNATENISNAQICSQIEILNEDFARRNADRNQTPSQFSEVAANTEIQFYLATRDPSGNVTNGITRTLTTFTGFTNVDGERVKLANSGHISWDTNAYLNIWTCDLLGNASGYSTLPQNFQNSPNFDGIVIDFSYFGNIGEATFPYHLGRTSSHEVGHWLGLNHI